MTKKADYIPRGDEGFNPWFKFIVQYTTSKCAGTTPEWKHIPKDAIETLAAAYAACILEIDFWSEGSAGKAKPYGHKTATRTPFRIQFRESDRGKKVHIALYWQAHKGGQSPWSVIQMAVVP